MSRHPYLKLLDDVNIHAGLLREWIAKDLHDATLEGIKDHQAKLVRQIKQLDIIKEKVEEDQEREKTRNRS